MFWAAVRPTSLSAVLAIAGCSAAPPAGGGAGAAAPAVAPADFSLDVTVRSGPVPAGPIDRTEAARSLRPARYVLFCDGSLHSAQDPVGPDQDLPRLTRVLDGRQMDELWLLLERLGLANPAAAASPVNAKLIEVPPGETLSIGIISGHGDRWAHAIVQGPPMAPDTALVELVEHLANLAWATAWTEPAEAIPYRDEFGPDPYARYRRP